MPEAIGAEIGFSVRTALKSRTTSDWIKALCTSKIAILEDAGWVVHDYRHSMTWNGFRKHGLLNLIAVCKRRRVGRARRVPPESRVPRWWDSPCSAHPATAFTFPTPLALPRNRISPAPTHTPPARPDPRREVLPRAPAGPFYPADCPAHKRPGKAAPRRLARKTGLPRNRSRKAASSMRSNSASSIGFESGRGWKAGSAVGGTRRLKGQTSWQMSQPKIRGPIDCALLGRNRLAKLDRQIGDALPRVEAIGLDDRARRTGVDAGPAGAAVAGRQGFVVDERFAGQQGGQQEPTSQLPVQEQACSCRPSPGRPTRRTRVPSSGAVSTTPRTAAPGVNSR